MTYRRAFGLDHLDRMSDHRGLFEHADGAVRRLEHGYCTDDNARLLAVASREPDTGHAHRLSRLALQFLLDGQAADGRWHNRMDSEGRWTDRASTDDCWGRSLSALGTAAAHHSDPDVRRRALDAFERGARHRSRWPRAMAFAALGAAEVVASHPHHGAARSLLNDLVAASVPRPPEPGTGRDRGARSVGSGLTTWNWPEPRLAYANATLAEGLIAAASALDRPAALARGLGRLDWLLSRETRNGHLSVTGVGGSGPDDVGPQFDQQPIEAAAMADACWRAYRCTGDDRWIAGIDLAARWFLGENDTGAAMFDAGTGGGYDGLRIDGVNINQGAESTIALVSTMQRSRSFAPAS